MPADVSTNQLDPTAQQEKKLGWAVVGLGELSCEEILPAFANCEHSELRSLISGDRAKALQLAEEYGVDAAQVYTYDQYDQIANDPTIDIVYIVLPNSQHAEYTVRAFRAGKHVLCEKPMADTPQECDQMIAAGYQANRKLMIAYRLHYEPLNQMAVHWMREKRFGRIQTITSSNTQMIEAPNIRLEKSEGGGPVTDIGIYCINAVRCLTGEVPQQIWASAYYIDDKRFREVPSTVSFALIFPSGVHAMCTCSFNAAVQRAFAVHCENGIVRMNPAFSYDRLRLFEERDGQIQEHRKDDFDQFAAEIDYFSQCVLRDEEPRSSGEDGKIDIQVIQAIQLSLQERRAVNWQEVIGS